MKIGLRRCLLVVTLSLPVAAGAFVWQHPALVTAAQLFERVIHTLSEQYVDTLPMDSLYLRAARGLVREFHDPFTELYTPAEWVRTKGLLDGNISGIGVSFYVKPGGVYLRTVYPGTPAAAAGLHVGDQIIQVDTMRFSPGITIQQASGRISGPAGTPVHLTVARAALGRPSSDTLKLTVVRAPVHLAAVPFTLLLDGHVGYIPLRQFIPRSADDVRTAIDTLRRAGATKFILDLRGNPGGLINEAISLCGLFLPPNQIVVRLRGRQGEEVEETSSAPPVMPDAPLVVLVDPGSASASEITSGALQDHDRAAVIGRRTYGKGVAQNIVSMPDGYKLKLTSESWYTPLGRSIQRERQLLPNGEYVEVHPDSLETDSDRRARPVYKSDAGRTIYGGGGIIPDLVVRDTLAAGAAPFIAAVKSNPERMQSILSSYAESLTRSKPRQTQTAMAIRAAFIRHLRAAGINLSRAVVATAGPYIDRLIAERIALEKGDLSSAKRVSLKNDVLLTLASTMLQQVMDQPTLFAAVQKQDGATR